MYTLATRRMTHLIPLRYYADLFATVRQHQSP